MRAMIHTFFVLFLVFSAQTAHAAMPGNPANATRYDVTVKKVELCSDAACTQTFVIGSSTKVFDIASASAGADVGSYVDIAGVPLHQTWTHVRVTIAPDIVITSSGTDQNGTPCNTNSGNTDSSHTALGAALALSASAQTLYVPNINAFAPDAPSAADFAAYDATKEDNSDVVITYPLTSPYINTDGTMPTVRVTFDTQSAVRFYDAGSGAVCRVFPAPPTVTIAVAS